MCHASQLARAFSLTEVVAVVMITAIIAAIAVPRFSGALARQRLEAAANRIAADLTVARRHAVLTNTPQTVTFNVDDDNYVHAGMKNLKTGSSDYTVDLAAEPYGVRLVYADLTSASESAGDTAVVFDIYGMPDSGGWIGVAVAKSYLWIGVNADTGRTEIRRIRPLGVPDVSAM